MATGEAKEQPKRTHEIVETLEIRKDVDFYSRKASDINRQLALAGIAFSWILVNEYQILAFVPLFAFALALATDLLYYIIGYVRVQNVYHEIGRGTKGDALIPYDLKKPISIVFWIKIFLTLVGYLFVIKELFTPAIDQVLERQEIEISINVMEYHEEGLIPLASVTIELTPFSNSSDSVKELSYPILLMTDENGQINQSLSVPKSDIYRISISKLGYKRMIVQHYINANRLTLKPIVLEKFTSLAP